MINADNWSKVLRVSHDTIAKRNGGHMVNLLSTDAEKLFWFVQYLAFIIVSPMQVAIIAWLCYQRIGTPSIIGLIIIILVVPLQGLKIIFLTKSNYYWLVLIIHIQGMWMRVFARLRLLTAEKQDIRIGLMNEIISCIKLIKMHCWEYSFADKIAEARKSEMNIIRLHWDLLKLRNRSITIYSGRQLQWHPRGSAKVSLLPTVTQIVSLLYY